MAFLLPSRWLRRFCAGVTLSLGWLARGAEEGQGREVGVGAITELMPCQVKGLPLLGPLPAEVQNYTACAAAPLSSVNPPPLAQQFVAFLSGPIGKPLFVAAGVTD